MALESLEMELTVVLGRAQLPLHRLLRMGRGAIVPLDPSPEDEVEILAAGLPIARGRVIIDRDAISVEVTSLIRKPEVTRIPGATIGGRLRSGAAELLAPEAA